MLHRVRVNLDQALAHSEGRLRWYFDCRGLPAPPFSGGTWDSWPAWAVDVWRICSGEEEAVKTWVLAESAEKEAQRGPAAEPGR